MLPIYQVDMYLRNRGSSNLFVAYCLNTCNSDAGYLYLGYSKCLAFIFMEYLAFPSTSLNKRIGDKVHGEIAPQSFNVAVSALMI